MIRAVVIAIGVLSSAVASAQSGTAQGEALFKQGMDLRAAGKIAEACDAFDASEKADPNLGTLMYLGDCRETNGELTSAWAAFLAAEQRTRSATDDEGVQIHAAAKDRAARLEPRLSKLTVIVPPASRVQGLEIVVGNQPFVASSWNLEFPIDGKTHTIVARAPGRREWVTTITIAPERDRKSVKVPLLDLGPVATSGGSAPIVIVQESTFALRALPYVLAVAAVGAFGGAVVVERTSRNAIDRARVTEEDAMQTAYWERAKGQRYKTIGLSVGGVACAGVAVWLWLRPRESKPNTSTVVQPVASSGFAGIQIDGAW